MTRFAYTGAVVHDGRAMQAATVIAEAGRVLHLQAPEASLDGAVEVALEGGILAPGFVDLQVNGGGGVMLNDNPTVAGLETIAAAHAGLGATSILPTLITDRPEVTRAVVEAASRALAAGVPGIVGLHLEGPHLSVARKGAHDPSLIRRMTADDLNALVAAVGHVPRLMVTVAPESVTPDQVSVLAAAGIIVSLGHTDADYATCRAYADAGARVATHLFNAMSQLGNREPGLVGAALSDGRMDAGLIADAIHVHPASIAAALAAKCGPGDVFLVSDAMAPAGSALAEFILNGRRVRCGQGRLILDDGTLAGADLDLARALRVMTADVGIPVDRAIGMATSVPARVIRSGDIGVIRTGAAADMVHLTDDLHLKAVWRGGEDVRRARPA